MDEKISIIVPVYKVELELSRCIESLLRQTYQNIEILLIDDGSPDKCPEICDYYAQKDKRVSSFHKRNGGLSDARNFGLKHSNGDYVLFVDSDDYIEDTACEILLKGFISSRVDFVVGAIKECRGNKISFQRRTGIHAGMEYTSKDFIIKSIIANEWYAPAVLNLYKKSFLLNNNLFFKTGYLFEDHEFLPRLYLAAERIVYVDFAFYNYIIRENSIMTSNECTPEKVSMSLEIYSEWYRIMMELEDGELQKYMFGILIRYYLRNCKVRHIKGWKVKGLNFKFALNNSLNFREKIKIIVFNYLPNIYFTL